MNNNSFGHLSILYPEVFSLFGQRLVASLLTEKPEDFGYEIGHLLELQTVQSQTRYPFTSAFKEMWITQAVLFFLLSQ